MAKKVVINLKNLNKIYYPRKNELFFALQNFNLKIKKGEKVAILGDNGAGKTTLLKILSGITEASSGELKIKGKVISLISLTAGFHPEFTGRENLRINAALLGLKSRKINKLEEKIIEFSGIRPFIDQPLYTYSSGMILRLGFSVAVHANPDILILDEEIIVGDQDFKAKAYEKIEEIFGKGKTIIVSSHWLAFLKRLCDRFVWLDKGEIKMDGGQEVLLEYKKQRYEWWRNEAEMEDQPSREIFELLRTLPFGESFEFLAASSSMEPFIIKGDSVKIVRTAAKDLKVGDVIAFWSEEFNDIVTHRIKKIKNGVVTKGDSSLIKDQKINKEDILGKIEKVKTKK